MDTGESFYFFWCGQKKRRDKGVGILIRKCKDLIFEEPDFADPRIMALNIEIKGFKTRVVSAYATTDCDGSIHQKYSFYRELKKACKKQNNHQKLFINGDFNATTAASLNQTYYDSKKAIEDPICNENGMRLKGFCKQLNLCMTQTFLDIDWKTDTLGIVEMEPLVK